MDTLKPPYKEYVSTLILRGIMDAEGTELKKVESLQKREYRIPQVIPFVEEGFFEVQLEYENRYVQSIFFNALIASDSEKIQHGFFELQIPVYKSLNHIKILKSETQKLFHEFDKNKIPN